MLLNIAGIVGPVSARDILVFLGVTCGLGGLAAIAAGRATAQTWRQPAQLGLYVVLIAIGVRLLSAALFAAPLDCLSCFALDLLVLAIAGFASYRLARSRQLARQYPWAFGGPEGK